MKKYAIMLILALVTLLSADGNCSMKSGSHCSNSNKKVEKDNSNEICPVMGNEIDKTIYVEHEDKKVYFCCSACIDQFKKNPEKYLKKIAETNKKVVKKEKAIKQKTCPVMGGDINKEFFTEYKGKKVYFCCPSCISTFKKNPEKYLEKLNK